MEERVNFSNSKGDNLAGIIVNPSGKKDSLIVILAHGHGSYKNSKTNLALTDSLTAKNIATFRFDFFGHGESAGEFADATLTEAVDGILSAIGFLKGEGYQKIGLEGSSYGGFASLIAASKSSDISVLVLKSPALDYKNWKNRMESGEFGKEWKNRGYTVYQTSDGKKIKLPYSFVELFADDGAKYDAFEIAKHVQPPTLIVHGDKDEDAPVDLSRKIATQIPNCKIEIVRGAGHSYKKTADFKRMISVITKFIVNS